MTETITRWRKRPVVIEAVRWTGANVGDVQALTGPSNFYPVEPEDRGDDPDQTAEVYDKLHSTWIAACPVPELQIGPCPVEGHDGEHLQARTGTTWMCAESLARAFAASGVTADPQLGEELAAADRATAEFRRQCSELAGELGAVRALLFKINDVMLTSGKTHQWKIQQVLELLGVFRPDGLRGVIASAAENADRDRELLAQGADALWACAKAALTVKPTLDQPYPDDPRWTPYTRWVERPAREAHDLAMAIRKHLRGTPAITGAGKES